MSRHNHSENTTVFDEASLRVIQAFEQTFPDGMHRLPIDEARIRHRNLAKAGDPGPSVHAVHDRMIETPSHTIPIRVYQPTPGLKPILIWFHGGAFALGSVDNADAICRELSVAADVVVVSVEYRLAPENPYPAGFEDCYTVVERVMRAPEEFGGSRKVAIGGDSAGGTLAAGVALKRRDERLPMPAFQLLVYPSPAMRVSSYEYADAPIVPATMASHFWNLYLTSDSDYVSPYAAPLMAPSHHGLPPAFIVIPEADSTRNDQLEYATKLVNAGVMASSKMYNGTAHGFFTAPRTIPSAAEAVIDAVGQLRAFLYPRHYGSLSKTVSEYDD